MGLVGDGGGFAVDGERKWVSDGQIWCMVYGGMVVWWYGGDGGEVCNVAVLWL